MYPQSRVVGLARKLLIALWKYVEGGEAVAGAEEPRWDNKPRFRAVKSRRPKEAL
jgi:hypothetical protein